jgi:hypothetical protein
LNGSRMRIPQFSRGLLQGGPSSLILAPTVRPTLSPA